MAITSASLSAKKRILTAGLCGRAGCPQAGRQVMHQLFAALAMRFEFSLQGIEA